LNLQSPFISIPFFRLKKKTEKKEKQREKREGKNQNQNQPKQKGEIKAFFVLLPDPH